MNKTEVYISSSGNQYVAVGRMPYCELVKGDHYAIPGMPGRAFRRGDRGLAPMPPGSWMEHFRQRVIGTMVILLERKQP